MAYEIKIEIPIQSYLKKMIQFYVPVEPMNIQQMNCQYSSLIYLSLQRQGFTNKRPQAQQKYNAALMVKLNQELVNENRFFIDDRRLSYIDSQLRNIFEQKLIDFLLFNAAEKGDLKKLCVAFLHKYEIEEHEISVDALIKKYQRWRESKGVKLNYRSKKKLNEPSLFE